MKWLLLIIVFDVSNDGMRQVMQATKVFRSEAACNAEGRRMARSTEYEEEGLRSFSICIPERAFQDE
jgi:hypothetical protein